MVAILLISQVVILVLLGRCLVRIADLRMEVAETLQLEVSDSSYDEEDLETSSEAEDAYEERLRQREEAFDKRIEEMKKELDAKMPDQRKGTEAPILHPMIENLPHDSVTDYETNPPSVEYAE